MTAVYHTWSIFYQPHVHLTKAKKNPHLTNRLKTIWAKKILGIVNVDVKVIGIPSLEPSLLLLGNHISYLDIPLLMAACEDISFVSKSELRQWPIIGAAAQLMGTVFVQRDNRNSRQLAKQQIGELLQNNRRIALFPSGTTCIREAKPWRNGPFEIARD